MYVVVRWSTTQWLIYVQETKQRIFVQCGGNRGRWLEKDKLEYVVTGLILFILLTTPREVSVERDRFLARAAKEKINIIAYHVRQYLSVNISF